MSFLQCLKYYLVVHCIICNMLFDTGNNMYILIGQLHAGNATLQTCIYYLYSTRKYVWHKQNFVYSMWYVHAFYKLVKYVGKMSISILNWELSYSCCKQYLTNCLIQCMHKTSLKKDPPCKRHCTLVYSYITRNASH